jgi:aminopeptidase YwaD
MRIDRRGFVVAAVLMGGLVSASFAQQATWTVKPEWVRAHEEFLASDAMGGRGSATHDEEITATYVASEFMGYGLKMAPGMNSYIQSIELFSPELDGHAALAAGSVRLEEGAGFDLMSSSGTSVSGPLVKMKFSDVATAKPARGSVVLLSGMPDISSGSRGFGSLRRAGVSVVMIEETPGLVGLYAMNGGKTSVPVRLTGETTAPRGGSTTLIVRGEATAKLEALADGTAVNVDLHAVPNANPRHTYNAIGYLEGTDPKAGTILLSAHLDHLGIGRPVNGDAIYNGANDDAAGTTAVMELAHALAAGPRLKRSVLFVCYGSEEIGELGSTYFGQHSPVPLKDLVTNLEFEMIGNQDPKMPKGVLLLTGWERSNLGPTLKAHGALLGPDPYPEQHFFERSDNYALALQGVVAHTAAGWGTVPTYHRPDDDMAHLDLPFMTAAIQSLVEPVRWLATSDFKPEWNPGGMPTR